MAERDIALKAVIREAAEECDRLQARLERVVELARRRWISDADIARAVMDQEGE